MNPQNPEPFPIELKRILSAEKRIGRITFWMTMVVLSGVALLFHFQGISVGAERFDTSVFKWLWIVWHDSVYDCDHGPFIPLIFIGLLWYRRNQILEIPVPTQEDIRGLIPILFAIAIHWVGLRGQITRLNVIALILLLWGMVWYFQGWKRAKVMSFAFSFLIFMIPMNFLESIITFPMRILVTNVSVAIAHFLGIPVILQGTQMFNPQIPYHYDIAPACSGIRSLMAIVMISLLFGYVTQDKLWKKTLLFAAGIPLAIVGNVVRVTAIVIAAQCFGSKAGDLVHDWFGFLIFAVVIALLILCSKLLNFDYRAWSQKLTSKLPK